MKATAWNNNEWRSSGAGYGVSISAADRDKHFLRAWPNVEIALPNGLKVTANTDKKSFWEGSCQHLICKGIGEWLINSGRGKWDKRQPPKFQLIPQKGRCFVLK